VCTILYTLPVEYICSSVSLKYILINEKNLTVNYRTDNEGNNIRHTVIPYLSEKTYQSFTSDYHYQQWKKTAY
jgi:hypothetical protein